MVQRIYMVYALTWFLLTFLMMLPLFFMADIFKWDKFGLKVNHLWAHIFFPIVGMPMKIKYETPLDKRKNYILCPNHFSYLDIAILPFLPIPFRFVGKVSIAKVPFFGYMFRRFHITVDRSKMRERYASYSESINSLKKGFSLAIFPEGGIKVKNPPQMQPFKEGAFRMAIETNTQLVPVTMADNWHIFADDRKFNFYRRPCRMVVHEPIDPSEYTIDQIPEFQSRVFDQIQNELNRLNKVG